MNESSKNESSKNENSKNENSKNENSKNESSKNTNARICGAPISWGVCEVPGWGFQLPPERVLDEAASLGLAKMEAGPPGFLPDDPEEAARSLAAHDMTLLGGFVTAVLHEESVRDSELAAVEERARTLRAAGGEFLILAAATGLDGYDETTELADAGWVTLLDGVSRAAEISERHGLAVSVHPHFGTLIERPRHVERLLEGSDAGLCLDTGHLAVGGGNPVEISREYAGRVNLAHIKDVDLSLSNAVAAGEKPYAEAVREGMFRPAGEGDLDLAEIIARIENAGYDGWYVLEQDVMLDADPAGTEPNGEGPFADVRTSLEYVAGRLSKVRGGAA